MKAFFVKYRIPFILALAAVLLELFVFNFRYWESLPYTAKRLDNPAIGSGFTRQPDGTLQVTGDDLYVEFSGVDAEVKNVYFDIVNEAYPKIHVNVGVILDDAANRDGLLLPAVAVLPSVPKSQYHRVYVSGKTTWIRLLLSGFAQGDCVRINEVSVNVRLPLLFSFVRCLLVFAFGLAVWAFRPKSKLWEPWFGKSQPASRKQILIAAVLVLVNVIVLWGVIHTDPNTSEMFFRNNDGRYQQLARSLSEGRFDLGYEVSPSLQNAENPYDHTIRKSDNIEYRWDVAYYNGKYYCYYGITPALLFHLPVYLLFGRGLSDAVPIFCFGALFVVAAFFLVYRIVRLQFLRVSYAMYLLLAEFFVVGSAVLAMVRVSTFYLLPAIGATSLVVAGLALWLFSMRGEKLHPVLLFLGSACMALVAGCRPQQLIFCLLAIPLFKGYVGKDKLVSLKKGWRYLVAFAVPFVVFGAFMMYYNAVRFGSPFNFGSAYNLTTNDLTHNVMPPVRALDGLIFYYMAPPVISSVFPFLSASLQETSYMGLRVIEQVYGGVFMVQPMLWAIFAAGRVKQSLKQKKLYGIVLFLTISGIFLGLFASVMAGLLLRYTLDFYFALCAAAILVLFTINETYTHESAQWNLRLFVGGCLAVCLVYNALLFYAAGDYRMIIPHDGIGYYNQKIYYDAMYAIQFWT